MLEFEGEKFYSIKDAAEILHLTPRTVWQKIKDGKLKAHKAGMSYNITSQAISDYLRGN